ncbi:MAG: hypothetical protein V4539_10320 [Bacteroidota bacterium]
MKTSKLLIAMAFVAVASGASAQSIDPVSLIIAKVIKAIDLKVQKLQNETIWLQQAQSLAENELSRIKLSEITGWQQQLSDLYAGYFAELKEVKSSITGMAQIKRIMEMQKQVVIEYGRMAKDAQVKIQYDALLNASMDVLQTLYAVLGSAYSMKDAERICMITTLKDAMSHCLTNIQSLNKQQLEMIANRTRIQADLQFVKKLNGIQ